MLKELSKQNWTEHRIKRYINFAYERKKKYTYRCIAIFIRFKCRWIIQWLVLRYILSTTKVWLESNCRIDKTIIQKIQINDIGKIENCLQVSTPAESSVADVSLKKKLKHIIKKQTNCLSEYQVCNNNLTTEVQREMLYFKRKK